MKNNRLTQKEYNTNLAIGIILLFMLFLIATVLTSCTTQRKTVSYKYEQVGDTIVETIKVPRGTLRK